MKYYLFAIVSILYLLNFTVGIYEVPDNLPIIGNLDEFAASALLIYSLQALRKRRRAVKQKDLKGE